MNSSFDLDFTEENNRIFLYDTFEFNFSPLYADKDYLEEKYIKEGLSTSQIARENDCAKSTITRHLKKHGIPLREPHKNHSNHAIVPYGKRRVKSETVEYKKEQKVIDAIFIMREYELSLRQIVKVLSCLGVPTKIQNRTWHPEMIRRILEQNKSSRCQK